MKKFCLNISVSGLAILFLLASYAPSRLLAGETYDIGVLLPLTGYREAIGTMEKQAFELAAEKFNQEAGNHDRQLNLVFIDSAATPETAVREVGRVLEEKGKSLRMLTGGCSSPAAWAVAKYAQQQQIPFLISTASSRRITGQNWNYIFRLGPPEEEYFLEPIARAIQDAGEYKSAAIIYENSICTTETARRLKQLCGRLKLDLSIWYGYRPGRKNFKRLGELLAEKQPEILLLAGRSSEAGIILSRCREMESPPALVFGCSPDFSRPEMWDIAGENAEGLKTVVLWKDFLPYAGAAEFAREYKLNFAKDPDYHAAEAYASLEIIADVFSRAQTFSRDELRDLLAATEMTTVFGPVRFISDSRYTNQNRLAGHLLQWHEGVLETVDH